MTDKVIKPFPPAVDPSEYAHLTPKQRMIAGYPYRPGDPELGKDRMAARQLLYKYNNTAPLEREMRREILRELLHPDSRDRAVFM